MSRVLRLLDDQRAFLIEQDGADFIRQVPRYIAALEDDSQVATLLDDLRHDGQTVFAEYDEHDRDLVPMLVELRNELVSIAPDADDSSMQPPSTGTPSWD